MLPAIVILLALLAPVHCQTATTIILEPIADFPATLTGPPEITISAVDDNGNVDTSYSSPQQLRLDFTVTPADGSAPRVFSIAESLNFNGQTVVDLLDDAFSIAQFRVASSVFVSVVSDDLAENTDSSRTFNINPDPTVRIEVTASASATAGSTVTISYQAFDQYDNLVSSGPNAFGQTLAVSANNGAQVTSAAFSDGEATSTVSSTTAVEVTATITAPSGITLDNNPVVIDFVPGATAKINLSPSFPSPVAQGSSVTYSLSATDAFNNVVPTETGTLSIVENSDTAVLSTASLTLSAGTGTFSLSNAEAEDVLVTISDSGSDFSGVSSFPSFTQRFFVQCDGITEFQDEVNAIVCKTIQTCDIGTFQGAVPTSTSDRRCDDCDGVTEFQDEAGATECKTATAACVAGFEETTALSASVDRICDACPADTFRIAQPNCVAHTVCVAGQVETVAPSSSVDRVCEDCGVGSADLDSISTTPCVLCGGSLSISAGTFTNSYTGTFQITQTQFDAASTLDYTIPAADVKVTIHTNPVSNNDCDTIGAVFGSIGDLTQKHAEFATDTTGSLTDNTLPLLGADSVAGRSIRVTDSADILLGCATLSVPSDQTFQDEAGQTVCKAITTCAAGEEESVSPEHTSDRSCRSCPSGEYQDTAGLPFCLVVSTCPAGQEEDVAPTASTDIVCKDVTCEGLAAPEFGAITTCSGTQLFGTECTASCPNANFVIASGDAARTCVQSGQFNGTQITCACDTGFSLNRDTEECLSQCPAEKFSVVGVCVDCTAACQVGTEFESSVCDPAANTNRVCTTCSACPVGQFVAGGCTGTQDTICSNETVCLAGEYEIAAPTETSDRDCDACAVCPMGSYEATGCCDNHDTVCETMLVCEDDEFESTAPIAAEQGGFESDRRCQKVKTCSAQEFEAAAPTSTTDRNCTSCTRCPEGQYAQTACTANADTVCMPFSTCANTEYVSVPGNENTDVTCATCRTCSPLEYESSPCDGENNTVCSLLTVCDPVLQFEMTAAQTAADRICANCTTECPDGEFKDAPCSASADLVCADAENTRFCERGEHFVIDNVGNELGCRACDDCADGTFAKGGKSCPVSAVQPVCEAWTTCSAGQYESTAGTATTDRICETCTPCPDGMYMTGGCTGTSDTVCTAWTECLATEFESVPGSSKTDRVCSTCTACPDGEWAESVCEGTSDTICSQRTLCPTNQFIRTEGDATTDRKCGACGPRVMGRATNASFCPDAPESLCDLAITTQAPSTDDSVGVGSASSGVDGAAIGGAVAGAVLLLLLILLVVFLLRDERKEASSSKGRTYDDPDEDLEAGEKYIEVNADDDMQMKSLEDGAAAEPVVMENSALFDSQIDEENRKLKEEVALMKAKIAEKSKVQKQQHKSKKTAESVLENTLAAKIAEENAQIEAEIRAMKSELNKKTKESKFNSAVSQQVKLKAQKAALEEELAAVEEVNRVKNEAASQLLARQENELVKREADF